MPMQKTFDTGHLHDGKVPQNTLPSSKCPPHSLNPKLLHRVFLRYLQLYVHVQIFLTTWSSFNCYKVMHMIIFVPVYSSYMYSGQTLEMQDSRKEKEKEVTCMVTGQ